MKKVLVTGAAGCVGENVIKYLLSEGMYEITALDLDNKKTLKRLKRYSKRVNVVYGDICDKELIGNLIKENDYVIHLATIIPPYTDLYHNSRDIEYNGTENIIKAINKYNKNCFLIYASTTSLYDNSLGASVKENIKVEELSNFSSLKYELENLIKEKLTNYTIFRVPLVLSDLKKDNFIYGVKKNIFVEVTTGQDAAYAFVKAIPYKAQLNKKTYNVGLGIKGRLQYKEILNNILKYYGINIKYILGRMFINKDYLSPFLTDSDVLDEIIHYHTDTLNKYYKRLNNNSKKRKISKLIGKIILKLKKG